MLFMFVITIIANQVFFQIVFILFTYLQDVISPLSQGLPRNSSL